MTRSRSPSSPPASIASTAPVVARPAGQVADAISELFAEDEADPLDRRRRRLRRPVVPALTAAPGSTTWPANLAAARARIDAAGGPVRRLLAVTKGFGPDADRAAVAAGCTAIGENYAQELLGKAEAVTAKGVAVHFIGQLQSNKVRLVAGIVAVWETVDRASARATRSPGGRPGPPCWCRSTRRGSPARAAARSADVAALVAAAGAAGLVVDGLMTVGPTEGGPEAARPAFRAVPAAVDRLGLRTCSMGMTDDLEVAVAGGHHPGPPRDGAVRPPRAERPTAGRPRWF